MVDGKGENATKGAWTLVFAINPSGIDSRPCCASAAVMLEVPKAIPTMTMNLHGIRSGRCLVKR